MIGIAKLSMAHVHAKGYANQIRDNAETELVAIWDEEEYGGKQAAEEYGVPYSENLDQVLSRDDVDAVVVAGPREAFSAQAVAALRSYVAGGGAVAFLLDRVAADVQALSATPVEHGLDSLLKEYGVTMGKSLALDTECATIAVTQQRGFFNSIC